MIFSENDRHLIILSGSHQDALDCAQRLCASIDFQLIDNPKQARQLLGQEYGAVILDTFDYFDANAFGAISGTIRTGGYLILIAPNKPQLSRFLKRFYHLAKQAKNVSYFDASNCPSVLPPLKHEVDFSYAIKEQSRAVDKIIHVVKGHRRRPLVLTADRGRGKSAALGIAARQLIKEGYQKLIVCAPSKRSAERVFYFALAEEQNNRALQFYSPDELHRQRPEADLVLIDEAAAIPIPLLSNFLSRYSRIVFASTQHGYEGSGRGFGINFRKVLNQLTPQWQSFRLDKPMRWYENDSLERFTFKALLLDAEPVDGSKVDGATIQNCQYCLVDKDELVKDKAQLNCLFGLLVSAHYQTRPSDLMQMLDDEAVSIHTLQFKGQIIAVALLIAEGNLDAALASDIFAGKRRLKGHLVAQSLAANVGIEEAPTLYGERISRIAVHPDLQRRGFGSLMLKKLIEKSRADYLSSSFGATTDVISFWRKAGFSAVYLGLKRDASSGTHSALMVYPLNEKGDAVKNKGKRHFAQSFPLLLSETFQDLEVDLVISLLGKPQELTLEADEIKVVEAFCYQQRSYESSIYPLWKLVCLMLPDTPVLSKSNAEIVVCKVLQKHSWRHITENMAEKVSGKKEAITLLRQASGKLLKSYTGDKKK